MSTATTTDPLAAAIAAAREPITEYFVNLPESGQRFPIPAEDAQTAQAVRDAIVPFFSEAAEADISCQQSGAQLVITLKTKPGGKG